MRCLCSQVLIRLLLLVGTMLSPALAASSSYAADETQLNGGYLGGFADRTGAVGLQAGFWSDYVGFTGSFGFAQESASLSVSGTTIDMTDQSEFTIGGGVKFGVDVGPAKPYMGLGLGVGMLKDTLNDSDVFGLELGIELGVALHPVRHLFIELSLFDFSTVLAGELDVAGATADLGGMMVRLMPGFSVNYVF